jgi:dTDP-4-dehydrorhamnose 3,5-epimerase-like enzyme
MSLTNWINFNLMGGEKGQLVALEQYNNIPFEIKRVYYIVNLKPHEPRGFHAHKELKQVVICLSGSCRILLDDGFQKDSAILESSEKGIYVDSKIWHEMHDFSDDCILLVLASEHYDELDYLRNYDDFLNLINHD